MSLICAANWARVVQAMATAAAESAGGDGGGDGDSESAAGPPMLVSRCFAHVRCAVEQADSLLSSALGWVLAPEQVGTCACLRVRVCARMCLCVFA
jgi:hypothetical protein